MARIVYIYQNLFSFVKDDLVLLKEHYKVRCFHFDSNRYDSKIGRLYGLLFFAGKQLFWLPRELLRARVVYGWFADYTANPHGTSFSQACGCCPWGI